MSDDCFLGVFILLLFLLDLFKPFVDAFLLAINFLSFLLFFQEDSFLFHLFLCFLSLHLDLLVEHLVMLLEVHLERVRHCVIARSLCEHLLHVLGCHGLHIAAEVRGHFVDLEKYFLVGCLISEQVQVIRFENIVPDVTIAGHRVKVILVDVESY